MAKLAIEKFPIEFEQIVMRSFQKHHWWHVDVMCDECVSALSVRDVHVHRNFSWFNILFRQLSVLCVDVCLNPNNDRVFTCKIVVSLHVHYHLFTNFDFFHRVRIWELRSFCSTYSQSARQAAIMQDGITLCFVIDKLAQNLREFIWKQCDSFQRWLLSWLCASAKQTLHFSLCLCLSIIIWSIRIPSLIKSTIHFLGASLICHIITIRIHILLPHRRSSHSIVSNGVPLCCFVFVWARQTFEIN